MSVINLLVAVEVAAMAGLAVLFWRSGDPRLALAQASYCVATLVLFIK
jgi:hypothetical protein